MDSAAKLLLPGIDYFQVVFTMPDKLSSLALGNRREIFDLLFRSAWHALKQVIEDEQQFEAAASMILHLWNQHLESHIHLHACVQIIKFTGAPMGITGSLVSEYDFVDW